MEGLGTTVDVVLINGTLREGDRIVVCGLGGPIVTRIKSLKTPQVLKEMRVKGALVEHKEVRTAHTYPAPLALPAYPRRQPSRLPEHPPPSGPLSYRTVTLPLRACAPAACHPNVCVPLSIVVLEGCATCYACMCFMPLCVDRE